MICRAELKPIFDSADQVVFICHSLGGLIVKEVLLSHPEFSKKVPTVVFYATPHGGSVIAAYASVISDDPLLDVMKGEGGDTYIVKARGTLESGKVASSQLLRL